MANPDAAPPLRADARRNRDAILTAAREVFASDGLSAPLDRIAKLADVGRATLYRRFPTREDLVRAIFQDNIEELQAIANELGDAPEAFWLILEAAVQQQRDNLGLVELFTRPPAPSASPSVGLADVRLPWSELIAGPLERAQRAGVVRPDLDPSDTGALLLMMGAMSSAVRYRDDADDRITRTLTLLRDALDPTGGPRELVPAGLA
ncbi:MAG: TetR/AcrR family transcriptional regulator [Solirubrobacteraceae bacterium]|nr:TetR/AcrR family transcriptional regulator [Solirubrobacteraceae bacterium]